MELFPSDSSAIFRVTSGHRKSEKGRRGIWFFGGVILITDKNKEVGVDEAAHLLGISERMVRCYVAERKLAAVKVKGKWFIDLASLEGLRGGARSAPDDDKPEQRDPPSVKVTDSRPRGPFGLACYRLCREGFASPRWSSLARGERLYELKTSVLESLGAGYYSYGMGKTHYYAEARARIGAILGILHSSSADETMWSEEIGWLERKVLPAFSSLLIKLERMGRRSSSASEAR